VYTVLSLLSHRYVFSQGANYIIVIIYAYYHGIALSQVFGQNKLRVIPMIQCSSELTASHHTG